jgi:hypothetical protein
MNEYNQCTGLADVVHTLAERHQSSHKGERAHALADDLSRKVGLEGRVGQRDLEQVVLLVQVVGAVDFEKI